VQRHTGGTLDVKATSRESALWAEMVRLPERSDGTIAGDGPAARALRQAAPQTLLLDDPGLMPWRDAARRDGIGSIRAVPLEGATVEWVLLACASGAEGASPLDVAYAAAACARAVSASEELERDRLLAAALRQCGNAAFIAGVEGDIVWCNAAFGRLTGYPPSEVLGRNPRFLSSGRHGVRHYRELWNTIRSGRVWRGETVDRDRSGTAFTALQTITPFGVDGRVTHYLAMYDDITRQTREDVRRQLRVGHDPLTGLMHRAALESQLSQILEHGQTVRIARVAARRLSALEALGTEAVDGVMAEIQSRLAAAVGPECAARLGPGDYLVCLPDDEFSAHQIVEELRTELSEPYPMIGALPDTELRVAQACSPRDGTDLDSLLRAADRALGVDPMKAACRRAMPMLDLDTRGTTT
jgi:PAS domain S-box-containing protein